MIEYNDKSDAESQISYKDSEFQSFEIRLNDNESQDSDFDKIEGMPQINKKIKEEMVKSGQEKDLKDRYSLIRIVVLSLLNSRCLTVYGKIPIHKPVLRPC